MPFLDFTDLTLAATELVQPRRLLAALGHEAPLEDGVVGAANAEHAVAAAREADVGDVAGVADVLAELGAPLDGRKAEELDEAEVVAGDDDLVGEVGVRGVDVRLVGVLLPDAVDLVAEHARECVPFDLFDLFLFAHLAFVALCWPAHTKETSVEL